MIPKTIHYIWLGGNELPKIAEKCIASWKKFCPDYEIKRWDESNLNIDICEYCREAYDCKKYAFASDVLRYDILAKEGGIYLDIDVEIIKPIDEFLKNACFMGFEKYNSVNPGLIIGAEKGNVDIQNLFNMYHKDHFLQDGKQNLKTVCERAVEYLVSKGLILNNKTQHVSTAMVYTSEFFNPTDLRTQKLKITRNTHSIHNYNASWYSLRQKFKRGVKTFFNKITFGLFGKIFLKK